MRKREREREGWPPALLLLLFIYDKTVPHQMESTRTHTMEFRVEGWKVAEWKKESPPPFHPFTLPSATLSLKESVGESFGGRRLKRWKGGGRSTFHAAASAS